MRETAIAERGWYRSGIQSHFAHDIVEFGCADLDQPDIFLVVDTLFPSGDGEHTYQARWHLKEPNATLEETTKTVATTDDGQPNLAIVPLLTDGLSVDLVSAQEEPEIMGLWIRKRVDIKAVPAATVCHTRSGRGIQQMATLLMPLPVGTPNPVVEVTLSGGDTEVRLSDRRRLICELDSQPEGHLKLTELLPDGTPGRSIHSG